ncbi:hypothetical protein D3C87_1410810 [compost metagenome]
MSSSFTTNPPFHHQRTKGLAEPDGFWKCLYSASADDEFNSAALVISVEKGKP